MDWDIKVIRRIAYGCRNNRNFGLRILLTNHKELKPKTARGASH